MSFLSKVVHSVYRSSNQQNIGTFCIATLAERFVPIRYTHSCLKTYINRNIENSSSCLTSSNSPGLFQTYTLRKYQSGEAGNNGNVEISKRISGLVANSDVVVFMKGVPSAPRCGFSNAVCQIFRMHNVEIDSHDVLEDEDLRQGIKEYSNWPTIPQVYFKGEFIGGCDILLQMHQSGELVEELAKIGIKSALVTEEENKDK